MTDTSGRGQQVSYLFTSRLHLDIFSSLIQCITGKNNLESSENFNHDKSKDENNLSLSLIILFIFLFAPLNHMPCHRQVLNVPSLTRVPKVADACYECSSLTDH